MEIKVFLVFIYCLPMTCSLCLSVPAPPPSLTHTHTHKMEAIERGTFTAKVIFSETHHPWSIQKEGQTT